MKRTPEDGPEEVALRLTREESLESAGQHGEESASWRERNIRWP